MYMFNRMFPNAGTKSHFGHFASAVAIKPVLWPAAVHYQKEQQHSVPPCLITGKSTLHVHAVVLTIAIPYFCGVLNAKKNLQQQGASKASPPACY